MNILPTSNLFPYRTSFSTGILYPIRNLLQKMIRQLPPGALLAIICALSAVATSKEMPQVILVENHSDVLVHWVETGIRNAVVVNVDAHDDCAPIPSEKINKLREYLKAGDIKAIGHANSEADFGLFSISDFISAACGLETAREVIWVAPTIRAPSLVRTHIPFSTTILDSLPELGKVPVLLTVDADCIPPFASRLCITPVEAINRVVSALRAVSWNTVHTSVAFSVDGGYLPLTLRWVGNALKESLEGKDPSRSDAPWPLLCTVEDWRRGLPPGVIVNKVKNLVEQYPENPWLRVYLADALFRSKNVPEALREGKMAAHLDPGCCRILTEIGRQLADAGRLNEAERFLVAAPAKIDVAAELALAQALERAGQTARAIDHLSRIRGVQANYSVELLMGYGYERLGNTSAARTHYLGAVSLLAAPVREMPAFPDLGPAALAAYRFLRTSGHKKEAKALRRDPRLVSLFN